MDINIPINELVELWVRSSVGIMKGVPDNHRTLGEMKEIRLMLDKKGIQNISIQSINNATCTCRYNHRGNIVTTEVVIKDI